MPETMTNEQSPTDDSPHDGHGERVVHTTDESLTTDGGHSSDDNNHVDDEDTDTATGDNGDGGPFDGFPPDTDEYPYDLQPSGDPSLLDEVGQSTVWDAALSEVAEHGKFKRSDLGLDLAGSTINQTLARMENLGWLRREGSYAKIWRLGPKAAHYLDVDDETIAQSKE